MVIEYQIKRIDFVKAYIYNLRYSSRTQLIVLGFAIFGDGQYLIVRHSPNRSLSVSDYVTALIFAGAAILLLPAISFVLAKTQKRVLAIDQEGIETRIGSKEGEIPWTAVESIAETNDRIVITGKNANAFTIPKNAFSSSEQRVKFFKLATRYHDDSKLML